MKPETVVFVGQAPNRTAWEHGLKLGAEIATDRQCVGRTPEEIAEKYCARVAITGSVGKKIAELVGFKLSLAFNGYARRNLNPRWNGKKGKGDSFDREEGKRRAAELIAGPWIRYVLLGDEVARCFGIKPEPLNVVTDWVGTVRKEFLLFPHPSGINQWWNEDFNRFRARKRLREFLAIMGPTERSQP